MPDAVQVGTECDNGMVLFITEDARLLSLAPLQLSLGRVEFAKTLLPLSFETTGNEAVLCIHGSIATLRSVCFVVSVFELSAPLCEGSVAVCECDRED